MKSTARLPHGSLALFTAAVNNIIIEIVVPYVNWQWKNHPSPKQYIDGGGFDYLTILSRFALSSVHEHCRWSLLVINPIIGSPSLWSARVVDDDIHHAT